MNKNLRLYILLGVLAVLLVAAGVVYYPTIRNLFNSKSSSTKTTESTVTTQAKKEIKLQPNGEGVAATEAPVPTNVQAPPTLPSIQ